MAFEYLCMTKKENDRLNREKVKMSGHWLNIKCDEYWVCFTETCNIQGVMGSVFKPKVGDSTHQWEPFILQKHQNSQNILGFPI